MPFLVVNPEEDLLVALAFLVVIPEGDLLFAPALTMNPAHLPPALSQNPNLAIGLASLGLCLIFIELNRPGRILPAACGVLLTLFSVAALLQDGIRPWAAALLLGCCAIFLMNWRRMLPVWLLALTTALTICSLRFMLTPGKAIEIHTPVAIVCGGVLGTLSVVLTRIAWRAWRAKALD